MTYLFMVIGWALVGWCGTRSPKPRPEPPPPPLKVFIWGVIGGIIGGFLWLIAFGLKVPLSNLDYAATCIGAFVLGFALEELVYQFTKG